MSGAVDAIRAYRAGMAAGQADQPATACPHDPAAATPQEQALARMWLRGYDKARPMKVATGAHKKSALAKPARPVRKPTRP